MPDKWKLQDMKYGLFVHFVPFLTVCADGTEPLSRNICQKNNLEYFAESFDVRQFLDDVAAMKVQYVIFTAWHARMILLYPSEVMKRIELENHQINGRDLIGEVIDGLNNLGIAVFLYTHPRDGHDMKSTDAQKAGWVKGTGTDPDFTKFDFNRWNDFINDIYKELVIRYGARIKGIFLDEGSSQGDSYRVVDYGRLINTIKSMNNNLILIQNFYGTTYGTDLGMKEFFYWNEFASVSGDKWPAFDMPTAVCLSKYGWWSSVSKGTEVCAYTPESIFRYIILQSAVNKKGCGAAWAAGPYPYGKGWEKNIKENMVRVGQLLQPIRIAVEGTRPSTAFPVKSGTTTGMINFVATKSEDGRREYIHVLNPPDSGKELCIGIPQDGSCYAERGTVLNNHALVHVVANPSTGEITLQLSAESDWASLTEKERLDYVIELNVTGYSKQNMSYLYIDDTDKSVIYSGGGWEYCRWQRNKHYGKGWQKDTGGDYEADIHRSPCTGASFEIAFEGIGIEYCPGTCQENSDNCDIYIDGNYVSTLSLKTDNYIAQNPVFSQTGLSNEKHIFKAVNRGSGYLVNDVVKILTVREN